MHAAPIPIRRARLQDLDAIMAMERLPGYEALVGRSPRAEHEAMLNDGRHAYFVGEGHAIEAFAILRDRADAHGNVYLKRIAVAQPGQGAGARFLCALIDRVFAGPLAHRFYLDCFRDNLRAQAMYAKLGFTRDGVLREAYLASDGGRRDLVLMALTKPEWISRAARAP